MNKLAVVKKSRSFDGPHWKILFTGTREECYTYMRNHRGWSDLIYLNDDGSLGRMSSWVL